MYDGFHAYGVFVCKGERGQKKILVLLVLFRLNTLIHTQNGRHAENESGEK